jgi:riboflavin kinase
MKAKVIKGSGEGAKYVEVYADKIYREVGMKPYPGTLNLQVDEIPPLDMIRVPGFGKFGAIDMAPCAVNYERAFAVFPEKGGHAEDNIVEIIAEKNIKAQLGLEDGDFVDLQF